MKFVEFVNEIYIEEAAVSAHGKVEMALRELGLTYKTRTENTGKLFLLDNGFTVVSNNNGEVGLYRQGIKGAIASVKTYDFNKIRELVSNMLKAKLPAIKTKEAIANEPKGVAKRAKGFRNIKGA